MTEYMDRPRLIAVWALEGCRLALTFANNQESIVDLSGDVRRLPALLPLQDEAVFLHAELGDDGWTVEWAGADIQIGADTLISGELTADGC
jgi:hypothetical protein